MTIVVINQKGGVAKTTTALSLGAALDERGHAVQFWDTDPQQDLLHLAQAAGFPCNSANALNLNLQLASAKADFHIIDTAPRDDAAMHQAVKIADVALIVVPAEYMTIRGLGRIVGSFGAGQSLNSISNARVLVTMYSPATSQAKQQLMSLPGFNFCKAVIPRQMVVSTAPGSGQTVLAYASDSRAAKAYRALAKEVEKWTP